MRQDFKVLGISFNFLYFMGKGLRVTGDIIWDKDIENSLWYIWKLRSSSRCSFFFYIVVICILKYGNPGNLYLSSIPFSSIEEQIQRLSLEDEQFYSYPTSINDENCPSTSNDEKNITDTNLHDNRKMPLSSSAASPCSSGNVNNLSEPIYAVVDLKNKYARRKMREMENENAINIQPERPRSFHVGSSDYEEVKFVLSQYVFTMSWFYYILHCGCLLCVVLNKYTEAITLFTAGTVYEAIRSEWRWRGKYLRTRKMIIETDLIAGIPFNVSTISRSTFRNFPMWKIPCGDTFPKSTLTRWSR